MPRCDHVLRSHDRRTVGDHGFFQHRRLKFHAQLTFSRSRTRLSQPRIVLRRDPGLCIGHRVHYIKNKGFEIVAVNVKDKRAEARAFIKDMKMTFPVMMDPTGEAGLLYGASGMPVTYLIDEKGMMIARLWGDADWYTPQARGLLTPRASPAP